MKNITEIVYNYETLIESFEIESLITVEDNDYQGSSYILLRNNNNYGILIFGWGSCSGCDTLQDITDSYSNSNQVTKIEILKNLNDFRNELYESITWRSRDEIEEYMRTKDFGLEWYGHNDGGRKFVKELKNYSF